MDQELYALGGLAGSQRRCSSVRPPPASCYCHHLEMTSCQKSVNLCLLIRRTNLLNFIPSNLKRRSHLSLLKSVACNNKKNNMINSGFTARCAVLRLHVVRPSVRLSVILVDQDQIGWKSWKLIARTISPTASLFLAQRPSTYSQGNMGKFWGD